MNDYETILSVIKHMEAVCPHEGIAMVTGSPCGGLRLSWRWMVDGEMKSLTRLVDNFTGVRLKQIIEQAGKEMG